MKELKVIKSYITTFDDNHNDMLLVSHTKENYASAKQIECYLKSEADKVIADKDKEIRSLNRALYKACANWADAEVFDRTVGIDDLNVEANRWALMRNKCLKKVEEWR